MKTTAAPEAGGTGDPRRKNLAYAVELYLLHLKMHPDDLGARKECRNAERGLKKLVGGSGFMAKARAKKIEIQANSIRMNKGDPEETMIACEKLLREDPDCVAALLRLGESAIAASQLPHDRDAALAGRVASAPAGE